jgi:hypothetical protein
MRRRVEEEDRQYYVMKERRNVSEDHLRRSNPLHQGEVIEHPYRGKPKKYLRLSSQGPLWKDL